MHWLLLSILFSSILMIIFISFKKYNVNTFYAIVVNYFVCILVALPFTLDYPLSAYTTGWLPFAILLGVFFIGLFFLIAKTTQNMGAAVTTVAMKLGYIFPILIAFIIYNESVTLIKLIGITLTIFAVLFTSFKKEEGSNKIDFSLLLYPLIIFLGSGIADSIVQGVNNNYFVDGGDEMFVLVTFMSAFSFGLIAAIIKMLKEKTNHFTPKTILAGIMLGIPNYFSIYMLFKALSVKSWEDSFVFPVNNIGIVILSTVFAVVIFKEKLNKLNLIGLALAVISILVLNLHNIF
ncbi:MAG: drug/metabolite transporter (DMT)-like permease [Planctomycetota bacterium]|jgi:drug/metabolite transporter (DMT)-like permease